MVFAVALWENELALSIVDHETEVRTVVIGQKKKETILEGKYDDNWYPIKKLCAFSGKLTY